MLELDHVFCMVSDPDQATRRLEDSETSAASPTIRQRNNPTSWTPVHIAS